MANPNVPGQIFQGPLVDKNGNATPVFARWLQDTLRRTYNSLDNQGQVVAATKVAGRTEGIGSTLKNVDAGGVLLAPGVDLSRPYVNKTFQHIDGKADLGTQVQNELAAVNQVKNAQLNSTNFCTVDSIDNGTTATIRVYGTGGPGTTWTRLVGATTQGPYPALSQAGFAYASAFYVMFDPSTSSFQVSASFADSLPDNLIFCGKLTTVASGGGGGTSGGGGSSGGSGGCTEIGTPLEFDAGNKVSIKIVPCSEWFDVQLDRGKDARRRLALAKGTLVTVFKKVEELQSGDLVEVEDGEVEKVVQVKRSRRKSYKQVPRVTPAGTYRGNGVRLHNMKMA